MAFKGVSKCAVRNCIEPCGAYSNLCDEHRMPGAVVAIADDTGVVTYWYAEHAGERGIVFLNDFALGDLFDGADGFRTELERQGFSAIRILKTPKELADAQAEVAKAPGFWSGPWETKYSWETRTHTAE